jgi:hypothetical protein
MYELEEVTDKEGKELAKEIGAIYAKTSAKQANGIDDLFNAITGQPALCASIIGKPNPS